MGQRIIRKAMRTKRFNPASRRVAKMNKALRRQINIIMGSIKDDIINGLDFTDEGEIIGLSEEIELFHKNTVDNLLKHFKNKITHRIKGFDDFISYKAITIKNKTILEVSTKAKKDGLGCFLDGKDFYVRRNPGTDKLEGKDLVEYCAKHFKKEKPQSRLDIN